MGVSPQYQQPQQQPQHQPHQQPQQQPQQQPHQQHQHQPQQPQQPQHQPQTQTQQPQKYHAIPARLDGNTSDIGGQRSTSAPHQKRYQPMSNGSDNVFPESNFRPASSRSNHRSPQQQHTQQRRPSSQTSQHGSSKLGAKQTGRRGSRPSGPRSRMVSMSLYIYIYLLYTFDLIYL